VPDANNRRLWLISGVLVPLLGALIAAVPLWIEVIKPRIDDDDKSAPTAVATVESTPTPNADLLAPALLDITDLPAGWARTDRRIIEEPCDLHITRQGIVGVTIAYEAIDSLGSSYVYQEVSQLAPQDAALIVNVVAATVDACPSSTATSPDGQLVASTVLPLVFPQLGDQSYAFREIVPGISQNFTTDTVVIRRGDYVSILSITDLGTPSDGTFDQFVEEAALTADARLAAIAPR
jgi:hypothetical protein